jgi:DNA repair protein RecO (recombination protein O)
MAPLETAATILSTLAYGETSKIARLATRELGVVSVIAKGARRPRSRFGAALQLLSEGTATIVPARHSDLHTLASFDLIQVHSGLGVSIERFAVASALGEMMLRCAPQHDAPETYVFFRHSLDLLETAPPETVNVLGLRMLWGLVNHLGFAPNLDRCVRDGVPVPHGAAAPFSAALGGALCGACARGQEATMLQATDRADLHALILGDVDLPSLEGRYGVAHRRLLDRYIRYHVAEGAALPALTFWVDQMWAARP